MKEIIFLSFLLSTASIYAKTLFVISDESRSLDYYVNGKEFSYAHDLNNLKHDFSYSKENTLVLIRIKKYSKKQQFKGSITLIRGGVEKSKSFKKLNTLDSIYRQYLTGRSDLFILGHTIRSEKLKRLVPTFNLNQNSETKNFEVIATSSCKMIFKENLYLFSSHTNYLVGSPINVHLSHLDFDKVNDVLTFSNPIVRASLYAKNSFDRISRFTKSNLALNLYELSLISEIDYSDKYSLLQLVNKKHIKLSKFENKSKDDISFIINSNDL